LNGTGLALKFNPFNPNILIIGGGFNSPGNRICYVDITTNDYGTFGDGFTNGHVKSIVVHPITGIIYVGGSFSSSGSTPLRNIAYFDDSTSTWESMGFGVSIDQENGSGEIFAISIHPQTGGKI